MKEQVNYIKEYYKKENHDFKSVIKELGNDDKIKSIKKEITRLTKELEDKSFELHKEVENSYGCDFVSIQNKVYIKYDGSRITNYYDSVTGLEIDDIPEDSIVYNIYNKIGYIDMVIGYNYDLASIITKEYKYNINKDNTKINLKLLGEKVISFLEKKVVKLVINDNDTIINECEPHYSDLKTLRVIKDAEFINNLYGVDYKGRYNLEELRAYNLINKSFEIILKTSPSEIMDDLLKQSIEKALPIYKIIGVSQDTYNKALSRNIITILYNNRDYISGKNNEKLGIKKTESEWLELIDKIMQYEEDLKFYDIGYSLNYHDEVGGLLKTLLYYYYKNDTNYYNDNSEIFRKYYSFGKFIDYVVNETINQGYTRVKDFIIELRDYLSMCDSDNIKPTLYSSYLKQTHDITSRNHKIKVEEENENIFKSRYKDFKEYNGKNYYVVAPKCSNDLKVEGDTLNHCVASYIKRVIDGECLIFFLRKNKQESLITFEVRHNAIVQVKGLHNRKPTQSEVQALKDFAKYRKLEVNF